MPNAIVIRTAGINCDAELCRAFELAGADVELVHLGHLLTKPDTLDRFDLIGFPGGFSYGDDIASGRILAMHVRERLYSKLKDAVERGACIIGVCNGFQVLAQVGLLPGPDDHQAWPDTPASPTITLTDNADARFIDAWTGMVPADDSPCVWTRNLAGFSPEVLTFPSAHGEGRLSAPDSVLDELESSGRIALRYREDLNGSARRIAGVCDRSGRVFGLMPHPERFLDWNRHPFWTRLPAETRRSQTPGLTLFRNAVEAIQTTAV